MGSAFRLGTELVAAVAVGTIIGFILDNWFDTKPWFIITFFFIGVIAGIMNVIRVAKNMQKKINRGIKLWQLIQCINFKSTKLGPEIKLGNVDLSFTNASLFMLISALTICLFLYFGSKQKSIIPSRLQLIAELFYNFIAKMISDTAGSKAKPYFPFIFTLFMFVLLCNMIGMLPYSFTVTSHIIVTLSNGIVYIHCSNNYWIY